MAQHFNDAGWHPLAEGIFIMISHPRSNAARLAEIRARVEKATPEPWRYYADDSASPDNEVAVVRGLEIYGPHRAVSCCDDGDFILHARQDIPWLVAKVEALQQQIALMALERRGYRLVLGARPDATE